MQIIFLDSHTLSLNEDMDFGKFNDIGDYKGYKLVEGDDVVGCCNNAEVIIVNKINITQEIIERLQKIELISVIATGYNNVDITSAKNNNIPVINVPNYAEFSVPQHTFALILNLVTKAYLYNEDVKRGQWEKSPDFGLLKYPTFELAGKKIGIIGFGAIGRGTAQIAEGFKMKVMASDIGDISGSGYKNHILDEVLREADIIAIHIPLNEKTENLIDSKAFNKMKRSAILINTARGGIVNEKDLADALNSGKIAGAGVDVLSKEPPSQGNPLLNGVKNLIITPHTAWSTREARQRMIDITANNIRSFLDGKIVNMVY